MSIDYSKCSICHEKDHTQNMLMPCKCQRWVHRLCLDKKRVVDKTYYNSCPLCGTTYNFEKKQIKKWRKHFEIYGSVFLDLLIFIMIFLACSKLLGTVLIRFGFKSDQISDPTLFGGIVLFGILGFISFIIGISYILNGQIPFFYSIRCDDENVLVMFVVIGIIVVVTATVYVTFITVKQRYERHQRSVGVKENVVKDYLRGVDII